MAYVGVQPPQKILFASLAIYTPLLKLWRRLCPHSGGTRQTFWIKLVPQKLDGLGYSVVKVA